MSPQHTYNLLSAFQVFLSLVTLGLLIRARELRTYWPMLVVSTWEVFPYVTLLLLRAFGPAHHVPRQQAYAIYFFTFWSVFVVQAVCAILLTYTIFDSAMRPLKGLHRLGRIVYLWAAALSVFIAIHSVTRPNIRMDLLEQAMAGEFQRSASILIISLIGFVCIAIRPMGLSVRSRVFGTGMGLIVVSATNALEANFFMKNRNIFGKYAMVQIITACAAELIWIFYFSRPEPKRKFVLLPTTSPFHHWNRISELLGHEPGYVAIGGVPPDSFAVAEIDIFKRASAKMKALEDSNKEAALPAGR